MTEMAMTGSLGSPCCGFILLFASLRNRSVSVSHFNIVSIFMILGGISYYLDYFNPSLSLTQNIDAMFFVLKTKFGDEFERLFRSVFERVDDCMKSVRKIDKSLKMFLGRIDCL